VKGLQVRAYFGQLFESLFAQLTTRQIEFLKVKSSLFCESNTVIDEID